jgi:hypothetical protein
LMRAYSAVHPLFAVMFTRAGMRLRGRLLAMCRKAAARVVNCILIEAIMWMRASPADTLVALAEAERRLAEIDDPAIEPLVAPILAELTEVIERLLERIAAGDLAARLTV